MVVTDEAWRSAQDMAADLKAISRRLRGLDPELKKKIKTAGRARVAEPMAETVRAAAARSRFHPKVSSAVRAMGGQVPSIKLTAARAAFSGGASTRDVVPGAVWGGGGQRDTNVPARSGRAGYTRRSTRQFAAPGVDFAYAPLASARSGLIQVWGELVDEVLAAQELT